MPIEPVVRLRLALLTDVLREIATDIARAQAALDLKAEFQIEDAGRRDSFLPTLAFCFTELEVDFNVAVTLAEFNKNKMLAVAVANPWTSAFFQTAGFKGHLRVRIAPRAQLSAPAQIEEE